MESSGSGGNEGIDGAIPMSDDRTRIRRDAPHLDPDSSSIPRSETGATHPRSAESVPGAVEAAASGERYGKFVRVQLLGEGNMGEVWKAWDLELRRWVALKFPKGGNREEIARSLREARTAGKLSHPNIAAIYETGEESGRHFIAMQYIAGVTLREYCRGDSRVLASLVRDAARAVHEAHRRGVVHRDLKPENLMVAAGSGEQEAAGQVFVMDFGLARSADAALSGSVSGQVVGTPGYFPPEQGRGDPADARSDVYALGATMYDLLAGRKTFSVPSIYELLIKLESEDPPSPGRVKPGVDGELGTIVMKCLEREPERRYATAAGLADDLDRWLRGEAILARPASVIYRLRKFSRRRAYVLVPVAAALVVAAAASGAWVRSRILRAGEVRHHLEEAARSEFSGDLEGARDLYHAAAALDPSSLQARDGAARAELGISAAAALRRKAVEDATGLFEVGRRDLERATRVLYLPSGTFEDLTARAGEARRKFEEGVAKAPHLAVGHHLLACAWDVEGEEERAEAGWKAALACDPGFAPSHFRLGRLYSLQAVLATLHSPTDDPSTKFEGAREIVEKAIRELEAATRGAGLDSEVEMEFARAVLAYAEVRLEDAAAICRAAIARFADREGCEELNFILGVSLKNSPEGAAAYDAAIRARPGFRQALYVRGLVRAGRQDLEGAREDFTSLIRIHPKFAPAWTCRGNARGRLGDVPGAKADLDHALELSPEDWVAHSNRGFARTLLDDLDGAIEDYTWILEKFPDQTATRAHRGHAWLKKGDFGKAIADYRRCAEQAPADPAHRISIGCALARSGRFDAAVSEFDEAIRLDARNLQAHHLRGSALADAGRTAEALLELEQVLALAGDDWTGREEVLQQIDKLKSGR